MNHLLQIGSARLSNSKHHVILSFENGVSGIIKSVDVERLLSGGLAKVPIKSETWLGADLVELLKLMAYLDLSSAELKRLIRKEVSDSPEGRGMIVRRGF